jgi:hypothetical protein
MKYIDIKDGVTIHLVIRGPKSDASSTTPASNTSTSTTASDTQASNARTNTTHSNTSGFPFGLGAMPGMGNLNFANTNFLDMQQQLQQQVLASNCLYKML